MGATLRKKGKSFYIVFSKESVKELGLYEGQNFNFEYEKGKITLKKAPKPKKKY